MLLDKKGATLRIQIAIVIFFALFFCSTLLILLLHILVTQRSFDNAIISNISEFGGNEKIIAFTKDVVSKNFFSSLAWLLVFNSIADFCIAYAVSIWICTPLENLFLGLSNAYRRGIPYVSFTNTRYKEIDNISDVISDMTNKYVNALESQTAFIQDISHELKTALAAIKSTGEIIQKLETPSIDDYKYYYQTSQHMMSKLINLVNRLSITNLSDNELYDNDELNLSELIENIIKTFEPIAKQKKINLDLSIDKNVKIKGSVKYLSIVISNLLDNAIKYSDKIDTNIEIVLRKRKNEIDFEVIDKGIGIPEQDLKDIFKRFHRGENAQDIEGTGLGLFIANKIINAHGGKIIVTSKYGAGTKVRIRL